MTVRELVARLIELDKPDARVFMNILEPYDDDAALLSEVVSTITTSKEDQELLDDVVVLS